MSDARRALTWDSG